MRKLSSIAKEFILIALTIVIALGFFLLTNERILNSNYLEALRSIALNDYQQFKSEFQYFPFLLFLLLRVVLPFIGLAYLLKLGMKWAKSKGPLFKKLHQRSLHFGFYHRPFHVVVIFLVLLIAERYMQTKGYSAGSYYKEFKLVEKLEDYGFQYSDSNGIMRIDRNSKYLPPYYAHVNRDGFRSKYEFDSASIATLKNQGKKLILFIGDSFTEGSSAMPRDSCFVDLIDKGSSYTTLNMGMYATDPLQYEMVAAQYVPQIKPDAVVVVTYSNDIMQYDRKPTPGLPIYYSSSAHTGDLWEAQKPIELGYKPGDVLKSPEEAYEFYKTYCTVSKNNFVGWLCSRSIFTTLVQRKFSADTKLLSARNTKYDLPYTYNHLKAIRNLCDSLQTPLVFFHIPGVKEFAEAPRKMIDRYKLSFKELPVHYVSGLTPNDHVSLEDDTHFNNRGHAKFAAYANSVLDSVLETMTPKR